MCKKNLILDSGVPLTLPLYPGDCNLPKEAPISAEDRIQSEDAKNNSTFVPTTVVKIGNEIIPQPNDVERNEVKPYTFANSVEIFNLPWANDKENNVDSDVESSRAFNTRIILQPPRNGTNKTEVVREIVEPILKPHSGKIGRSHDLSRDKTEISEPILGPTTGKPIQITSAAALGKNSINDNNLDNRGVHYNFYEVTGDAGNDWIPAATSARSEKWKRQDDSRVLPAAENANSNTGPEEGGFNAIVRTVQFLPQRIARMFEEAEKYARERILPLVSNYTPRFLTDFITPRERPKYIPVAYDEAGPSSPETSTNCPHNHSKSSEDAMPIKPTEQTEDFFSDYTNYTDTSTSGNVTSESLNRTRQTYIQKIPRKSERVTIVYPVSSVVSGGTEKPVDKEDARSKKEEIEVQSQREGTIKREIKEIRIDLPVFEEDQNVLYIPVREELIKSEN